MTAQSGELAKNFFDKGEYKKALKTYEELAKEHPSNPNFFFGLVASYQQLENFKAAEELLRSRLDSSANNPAILIEIGHNFELQDNIEKAQKFYDEALGVINARPNYAYGIARGFEKYSLLDYAAKAYERAMELSSDRNFNLQLARIYGEQGKTEQMFSNYLDLIDLDPKFLNLANREFSKYISEDASSNSNVIFRKLLLKKLQGNPSLVYSEMLSWLFVQEKQFARAFAQEKAIYRRENTGLESILNLAVIAKNEGDIDAAKKIVQYVISETPSETIVIQGEQFLLNLEIESSEIKKNSAILKRFEDLLEKYGTGINTIALQIDYANFLAFNMAQEAVAVSVLKELSEKAQKPLEKAMVKMALADILVLQERFNEALIYFSQVQQLMKNDQISQIARFKVAKTSYYKGDFKWAKTQLDVLKSSTSQLIANDAMELSLLIEDNSLEDSTQTALKKYAMADFLSFQNKNEESVEILNELLENHKGESVEDEALFMQGRLFEELGEFEKAEENYLKITDLYRDDILADNATYFLAELYANVLNEPEKAKTFYEQIIFNFADSIYFVDARKKYRLLRGDTLE